MVFKTHISKCILAFFLGLMILSACVDTVNLHLPLGTERTVIGGWITTNDEPYFISVARTIAFNDQDSDPGVSGAEVYVLNRLSERFDFNESSKNGYYESDPNEFVGKEGERYTLYVNLKDGSQYVSSSEFLQAVPELDTLFFGTSFDPILPVSDPEAEVFFAKGRIIDTPNVRNYYRWKMYINDTLRNKPEEFVIFNDKFTNGNIFETKVTDVLLKSSDSLRLEHWSLSKRAFDYYSLLISQISSDQIGPSTRATAVRGNIRSLTDQEELVLGYFGASDVFVKGAKVRP